MKYLYSINEMLNDQNWLYHSLDVEYADEYLKSGILKCVSHQRKWKDGKRYRDDHPEYNNSTFYRGISTTRDKKFAARFGQVILQFDRNEIKHKYHLLPYNWSYSIASSNNTKNEKEEFIVMGESKDVNDRMKNKPKTYGELPISLLKGIFINKTSYDIYKGKGFESIIEHPLFKGFLDRNGMLIKGE